MPADYLPVLRNSVNVVRSYGGILNQPLKRLRRHMSLLPEAPELEPDPGAKNKNKDGNNLNPYLLII